MSEDARELYSDLEAMRQRVVGHEWTDAQTRAAAQELEAALYAEEERLLEEGTPCATR